MDIYSVTTGETLDLEPDERSAEEWREVLSDEEFRVLRKKGTERAFTGRYCNHHEAGLYRCAGCGTDLFSSEAKFDSGTGWPSFFESVAESNVEEVADRSLFMRRTEVVCRRCGGHLGHVFPDGPRPTGQRYCMNGAALRFDPDAASDEGVRHSESPPEGEET